MVMIGNKSDLFYKQMFFTGLLLMLMVGCEQRNKEKLPIEVTWDRDLCQECRMVLSDNRYAAQIVDTKGKNFLFDDVGCAVLWLRKKDWRDSARIWVSDYKTSKWIEADKANWQYGDPHTPMGYGYSATNSSVKDALNFETVKKWIYVGKTLVNENSAKHMNAGHQQPAKEKTNDQLPTFKEKE
jgi:copper chaperone NosL